LPLDIIVNAAPSCKREIAQLRAGIAVALLTIFYGLVFYCVAEILLVNAKTPEAQV
jgi:hypothetical protein